MSTTPQKPAGSAGTSDQDTARTAAADLGKEAQDKARHFGEDMAERARGQAEAAKKGAAEEISSVSKALRRASEELRDGSPQERTFGAAANALADFAETVRDKDMGEMVHELSDFARRNPVGFLGGAALLGFAGVRLAKASRRARDDDDMTAPAGGYAHTGTSTGASTGTSAGMGTTTGATGTGTGAAAGSTPGTPAGTGSTNRGPGTTPATPRTGETS